MIDRAGIVVQGGVEAAAGGDHVPGCVADVPFANHVGCVPGLLQLLRDEGLCDNNPLVSAKTIVARDLERTMLRAAPEPGR